MFRRVMLGRGMAKVRIAIEILFWVSSIAWIGLYFADYNTASDLVLASTALPALIYILLDDSILYVLNGRSPKSRTIKD